MPIPNLPQKQSWRKKPQKSSADHSRRSRKFRWFFLKENFIKKAFIATGIIAASFILFIIGAFAWISRDLPNPNKLIDRSLAESTKIFGRDGKTLLYEIHGDQRRTVVQLDDIPLSVRNATIIAEDRGFYGHHGFSIKGMVRALIMNFVKGQTVQGGSTITQQFIKNAILTSEKKYARKIKELVLAYQIENKFTKDQILQLYLNEIPYGSTAYGVESASWIFFGTSVKDVSLAQSAILASLPKAPSALSPFSGNRDNLIARAQFILDEMAKANIISLEEAEKAKKEKIAFQSRIENITAPHFVFYVQQLLAEKFSEKEVEQGGLEVITTLDSQKQQFAEEAIAKFVDKNAAQYNANNAALVSLDTKTGQILAMVGSKDYFNDDIDGQVNVALRPRQPGSSFKPIVYVTAFSRGYPQDTVLFDLETDFATDTKPYHPKNYNLKEHGPVTMRKALAGSLNIPAVKTLYLAGISNVLDMANLLGYTTLRDRSRFGLSLVLGGGEITLLEHTNAYAAFSREGIRHPTSAILKVLDRNGKILDKYEDSKERVIKKEYVQTLTNILSDNEARAFIFGSSNHLTLPDRPVAAKTGTTNDYRDAWTIGYTPSLAAGVWVGNNDNSEMKRGADGSVVAAPIWNEYMRKALAGTPSETFQPPKDAEKNEKPMLNGSFITEITQTVDRTTGLVIPKECEDSIPKKYQTTKTAKEVHTVLHYVNKENPNGPVPEDPILDPQYQSWERSVSAWALANGYLTGPSQTIECEARNPDLDPELMIKKPKDNEELTNGTFDIEIKVQPATGRKIESVVALIDGNMIDQTEERPWVFDYSPTILTSGKHTLTIKAIDSKGSFIEKSVEFTFINTRRGKNSILVPKDNSIIQKSQFPFEGKIFVPDFEHILSIDIIAERDNAQTTIDVINTLQSENGSFTWTDADQGEYSLFLQTHSPVKTTSTDRITVTVE